MSPSLDWPSLAYLSEFDLPRLLLLTRGVAKRSSTRYRRVLSSIGERSFFKGDPREGANLAARAGHLHVLEWLEKRDILPDEGGADEAAREGHLHVLEWLAQRNILPAVRSANRAAREGNLDVLNWLAERGIYPQ